MKKKLLVNLSLLFLFCLAKTTFTYAQGDVCSCSPSTYKWTLDFLSTCLDTGFPDPDEDKGVSDASCLIINKDNQSSSDMTPVKVTGYQIVEQDASFTALKTESNLNLNLNDGGEIEYDSFTSMAGLEEEDYPFVLSVTVYAVNANGEEIDLVTLVKFSGTCQLEVFGNGDTIGWLKFEGSIPAQDQYCGISSEAPSRITASPTGSIKPTPSPSAAPITPTTSPSISPTDSIKPSPSPSAAPNSPSDLPSLIPSDSPTSLPSFEPSWLDDKQCKKKDPKNDKCTALGGRCKLNCMEDDDFECVPGLCSYNRKWNKPSKSTKLRELKEDKVEVVDFEISADGKTERNLKAPKKPKAPKEPKSSCACRVPTASG